jgi:outer membrane protein assembly factor BamB
MRTALAMAAAGVLLAAGTAATGHADDGQDERQRRLEAGFERMLSGAELVGHFVVDGTDPDAPLEEDRYAVSRVTKLSGDVWRFDCRVQYGERDVTVPIPLAVKWAGDTPVITLTDMNIPGLGTYTARVLLHRDRYAGTWQAGDHGGQMFGRIVPAAPAPPGAATPGAATPGAGDTPAAGSWPSFRGPAASGVAAGPAPPRQWNVEDGTNVRWTTEIPGLAHSSPVIWGDRLIVTTAVPVGEGDDELRVGLYGSIQPVQDDRVHQFNVYCLDRRDGSVLWSRVAHEGVPEVKRHPKSSHAASTPATDGRYVLAFFGSEGLYCYDMEGTLLWSRDFGVLDSAFFMVPTAQWGFASSPVIHENMVIVQCDVLENSFLAALDIATGEEIWRTPRSDVPTWSTPAVHVDESGRGQVIVNGWKHIGGYDLATGAERWKLTGGGDIPVPTPVIAHGLVFITNAHGRMAPIYAIRTTATGDLGEGEGSEHMAWMVPRRGNYMQTPLVYGDHLYCCADNGVLTCYDAVTPASRPRWSPRTACSSRRASKATSTC